jgi:hypothetical protein
MEFHGVFNWSYHLETRTDGRAVEYRLHLEGLSPARNPGDVRLVVEGGTSRMRGPGTDDECVLFPSEFKLGPIFLTPDDLVDPNRIGELLVPLKIESVTGADTIHYTVRAESLDEWHDLEMEIWRDESAGAVLRSELSAAGPDPYFNAGWGTLSAQFLVNQVGPQTIDPIAGCEIDLPLPADATRLVKLPGLVGFDSTAAPQETSAFYQAELAGIGWAPVAEPQVSGSVILLSYRRDKQMLEINIESSDRGAHVELLLSTE